MMRPTERIYIAGHMTGLPEFNYPAFHAAAAHLRSLGFEVLSPAEHGLPMNLHWTAYMRHALQQLLRCDSVFFLDGWTSSRGARLESVVAWALDMPRYHQGSHFL